MSQFSHPDAMAPRKPGRTRVAAPRTPTAWSSQPRMRVYSLFGWTGLVYLLLGFLVLRVVWALGEGPDAWQRALASFDHPLYIAFHALSLASVIFVGVRFFRLFPKAQPARIGPAKPPPGPILQALLYVVWVGVTVLFATILAGGLF